MTDINHSRRQDNVCPIPAYACGINFAVVMQATITIEAGQQLLYDYGSAFWNSRYPHPSDPRRILIDYF
jgi:hypothetical protein